MAVEIVKENVECTTSVKIGVQDFLNQRDILNRVASGEPISDDDRNEVEGIIGFYDYFTDVLYDMGCLISEEAE